MSSLNPWPDKARFMLGGVFMAEEYERARADYWEARCRVAVEALERCYDVTEWPGPGGGSHQELALKAIGPLPPLPGKAGE